MKTGFRGDGRRRSARKHGIRRRDRRRRARGARGCDPAQADQSGDHRLPARKGLGGRRAYPLGRGDGPDRHQRTYSGLEGQGRADRYAGDRRPVLSAGTRGLDPHPEFRDAAGDVESRQLHREPVQRLQMAGDAGRRPRRGNLSGLSRGRSRGRERHRERRHDRRSRRRQGRSSQGGLHAGHEHPGQVHAVRGGRARLAEQAAAQRLQSHRRPRLSEVRHRREGIVGAAEGQASARAGAAHGRLAAFQRHGRRAILLSLG